jgi:hypothetical protein
VTFINSVKQIMPAMGCPTVYVKRENVATAVGTVVTAMPSSGVFAPSPIQSGRVRIKTVSIVSTGTVQQGIVTATDGTTTVTVCPQQTAGAANLLMDFTFEFQTDLNNTSMSITVIAGTANSVHDMEVAGNP